MIPSMWDIMKGTHYKPFLEHFRIAAGLSEGRYRGAKWNDGDFYKWMEAVCATLAIHPNPEWEARLDEIIGLIGKAQREDGYIHTPVLIGARNGDENAKPFADRFNFEVYNMGHLMSAACLHHSVTGKEEFLNIAKKSADFLDGAFANPTAERARHAICPSHYMGILDLYRATGEARYLELADRLVRMRDMVVDGGDDNQDRVPLGQQTEAVGHAVRANYLYAGVADLFVETGDPELFRPLTKIWENMVQKKMYITGGCGALYDGASPDGSKHQTTITRTHQAYGRNYQLPNTTAHNETCANIGSALWNWRMFLATGDAKYIDVAELTLYNSVLSGVSLNGKDYFYTNPLRQLNRPPVDLRWSRLRVPFVTSYCCPPNVVRTVAEVQGYAYAKDDDNVWVNLYGSSRLTTEIGAGRIVLEQRTDYPWDGTVSVTVHECTADKPVSLNFRIPGWADGAAIQMDGTTVSNDAAPGTFLMVKQKWMPGTTVQLNFDMPARLIESHPLVEETRNHVAIKRGPVVYCLESHELPEGVGINEVRIPESLRPEPEFRGDFLGGVTVLKAEITDGGDGEDWDGKLYRAFSRERSNAKRIPASFIPYYAWANRGSSEMSVWLPLE